MNDADRDLLRLAGKAIGVEIDWKRWKTSGNDEYLADVASPYILPHLIQRWDPLNDDGDAFRLMLALKLDVPGNWVTGNFRYVTFEGKIYTENNADQLAAARRAIVRAAAAIGAKL